MQIADDPSLLRPEECDCEETINKLPTPTEWLEAYCPSDQTAYSQLFEDLKNFEVIDFEKALQKVETHWGHPDQARSAAVCRYKLSGNEVSCLLIRQG